MCNEIFELKTSQMQTEEKIKNFIYLKATIPYFLTCWGKNLLKVKTTDNQLDTLIKGCLKQERTSQEALYKLFYGYAMSVCIRYGANDDEAVEILNDGFLKVFQKIDKYNEQLNFKAWLRKVMINTALDHYRKNKKHYQKVAIESIETTLEVRNDVVSTISHQEILKLVQRLSPVYRAVFNLYVIDGYSHDEIATQLNISVGSSKSNLFKARENLKRLLINVHHYEYAKYTG